MFQNLKVDIIYYKTNTDFELEFNLGGCCRMRLLNDKSPDKKSLVAGLSRAVSRSRVIIVTGYLFGDDGIINTVSRAIGTSATEIDKNQYGITAEGEIKVINGATPLVTPDGIFGGCIIERGPQSMILLTENRAVRKKLMNNLIYPYIEELYASELQAKVSASADRNAATAPEAPFVPVAEPPKPDVFDDIFSSLNSAADSVLDSEQVKDDTETVTDTETETKGAVSQPNEDEPTDANEPINEIEKTEPESIQTESVPEGAANSPFTFDFLPQDDGLSVSDDEYAKSDDTLSDEKDENVELYGDMIFETDGEEYQPTEPVYDNSNDFMIDSNDYLFSSPDDSVQLRDNSEDSNDNEYLVEHQSMPSIFAGNIPIMIVAVLLLVLIALFVYFGIYLPSKDGVSSAEFIRETFARLFG